MEITTTLICGDEHETSVFATSYSDDLSILFSFPFEPCQPKSVNSRVVACFHEFKVKDPECSFPSRKEMRQVLHASIVQIWRDCASHPSIRLPDVVVQIGEKSGGMIVWRISHESSYREYVECLMPSELVQSSLILDSQPTRTAFVSLETLRFFAVLGGRGDTTIVQLEGGTDSKTTYVYKGLSFRLFLEQGAGFGDERQAFYHELGLIYSLPRHPNVVSPPNFLVTTKIPILDTSSPTKSKTYVCGALYLYLRRESLQEALNKSNATGERLPLILKAKWARQIASALAATHVSCQYHMDLKPSNILLDDDENAVLIDWEQSGASPFFMAPEADGSWDVKIERLQPDGNGVSQDSAETPKLMYQKHTGAPRENHWKWPRWNIFPIWQIECPAALRAAEVYSLGRTLWVIFEQVSQVYSVGDGNDFTPGPISWGLRTADIPSHWKDFVNECVDPNPNFRPDLDTAVSFWEQECKM